MAVFSWFAPSFAVKNIESMGFHKSSDGSKKRRSKRDSRVKPIDVVSPSIANGSMKRKGKLGLWVKPTDIVIPTTAAGNKKRRSKWGLRVKHIDIASPSKADSSKKRGSKWGFRVKPIDIASPSTADSSKKRRSKWGFRVKPTDIASPSAEDGTKKRRSKWGLRVKSMDIVCPSTENEPRKLYLPLSRSFPSVEKIYSISPSMLSDNSLARAEPTGEVVFEVCHEEDENLLMKRVISDLDLQTKEQITSHGSNTELNNFLEEKIEIDEGVTLQAVIARGHASDPWIEFMNSPMLKRSCSNIETKQAKELVKSPKRSNSFSDTHSSPLCVWTSSSADLVMLKRLSSTQILPSRSEKIWRKLLWNNNNLHRSRAPERNLEDKLSFDIREPDLGLDNTKNKPADLDKQWVASSSGNSHIDRVKAWVNSLEDYSFFPVDDEECCEEIEDEQTANLHHLEIRESSLKSCSDICQLEAEEVVQRNSIIQSINSFSSVAHISSIGLKVLPSISAFVHLRSANLSGNCIVQITPGSLPKSLHTLDLSRNKISSIEGLRDLERLKILNLSYNRITRIGHGLSNCTLIKELYLASNKISAVDGLHRVLKLTVLDLSFNKITTAKALGQLVANYNCLLALNLTGNPIQANIGDEQLKKEVLGLLPHVTYLNKQSIKPHKVHEVPTKSVAKAALGDGPRRKMSRRLSQDFGSSSKRRIAEGSSRSVKRRSKSMQSSPNRK